MKKLAINNISKSIKRQAILTDVNLTVNSGEICAIIGSNGSGKTTLLKILTGLLQADGGEIYLDDTSLFLDKSREYLRHMGVIFANHGDLFDMTVKELFEDHFRYLNIPPKDIQASLKKFNLHIHLTTKISELSLGMERRLLLALMDSHHPQILLLDEPFNGLDIDHIDLLKQYLVDFVAQGGMVLLAAHNFNDIEDILTSVAVLNKGRLSDKMMMPDILANYQTIKNYYRTILNQKRGEGIELL